jgi:hypothetical protein
MYNNANKQSTLLKVEGNWDACRLYGRDSLTFRGLPTEEILSQQHSLSGFFCCRGFPTYLFGFGACRKRSFPLQLCRLVFTSPGRTATQKVNFVLKLKHLKYICIQIKVLCKYPPLRITKMQNDHADIVIAALLQSLSA